MRDLYIKPEVQFKRFDILDVIKTSPSPSEKPGDPDGDNDDPDWSNLY